MTEEQKNELAGAFINQTFTKDEIIVREGDSAASFYFIKSGILQCIKESTGEMVRELTKGTTFGESALYANSNRSLTVKAASDKAEVLALGRDNLQQILGSKIETAIYRNYQKWGLQRDPILNSLSEISKERILEQFEQVNTPAGQVILNKDDIVDKIIVCVQGTMQLEKPGEGIKCFSMGEAFGAEYLYPVERKKEKLAGVLTMKKEGVISEVSFASIGYVLGKSVKESIEEARYLKEEEQQLESHRGSKSRASKNPGNETWNLKNLIFIDKLGEGQFGNVYLVKDSSSKKLYALKCVSIAQVLEDKIEDHILVSSMLMKRTNSTC